jgi:hypothetical protein
MSSIWSLSSVIAWTQFFFTADMILECFVGLNKLTVVVFNTFVSFDDRISTDCSADLKTARVCDIVLAKDLPI